MPATARQKVREAAQWYRADGQKIARASSTRSSAWSLSRDAFPKGATGVGSPGQDALSFSTGAGPSLIDDSAPRTSTSHFRNGSGSSCASATNSCFSLASDEVYIWQFVGADYKRVSIGSFETNRYGAEQGYPSDRVLLQRRAPNGQLSKSSSICTFDGPMFDLASLSARYCARHSFCMKDQIASAT